jgi:hypothetical protein
VQNLNCEKSSPKITAFDMAIPEAPTINKKTFEAQLDLDNEAQELHRVGRGFLGREDEKDKSIQRSSLSRYGGGVP